MKLQRTNRGFTLIELLVVITIIGILATGAVSIYTSQIQKARDTVRVTDMTALKGGLEQVFQDLGMYPGRAATQSATSDCSPSGTTTNTSVYCTVELGYINSLPKDPKSGQAGNASALDYTYNVGHLDGVMNQVYEISTGVESDGIKISKADNGVDGGNDDNRIEFGIPGKGLHTCVNGTSSCTGNSSTTKITAASCTTLNAATGNVVISGNCN